MSHFLQDLCYAVRRLAQARSAAIVLTLALGIGANTSMLTLFNALLFKPDSLTFVAGAIVLCAAVAFASFLPAPSAAYVEPMVAPRYD